MIRRLSFVLPIAALGLLFAKPSAQEATGEIYGTVSDAQGGGVPGVEIRAQGLGPELIGTAVSRGGDGSFSIRVVPAIYRVTFQATSFRRTRLDLQVKSGERVNASVTLQVAGEHEGLGMVPAAAAGLVVMTTGVGDITLLVDAVHAPDTARNFLKYVDANLYDGGRFYRVTRPDNYVPVLPDRPMMEIIQGGLDPSQASKRFPAIPLERTSVTGIKHVVGTVSMARGAPDSATSEFFILLDDQPSLDFGGKRFADGQGGAAFGNVISGLDVVRKIQRQPAQGQNLTTPVTITRITRVR